MADQIEAIERALAESTQKAIPIENDVSFDDRINQLSDEELGVYIDLMNFNTVAMII